MSRDELLADDDLKPGQNGHLVCHLSDQSPIEIPLKISPGIPAEVGYYLVRGILRYLLDQGAPALLSPAV